MKNFLFFIFIFIFISNCTENKKIFKNQDNVPNRAQTINYNINNELNKTQSNEELLAVESLKAIEEDNVNKLEALFKKGLRINRKYNGKSLLFKAVRDNKENCIRFLLSRGAIVSEEFREGNLKDRKIPSSSSTVSWKRSVSLDDLTNYDQSFGNLRRRQHQLAIEAFSELPSKSYINEENYILNRLLAGANVNEWKDDILGKEYTSLHELARCKGTPKILEEFLKRFEKDVDQVDSEGRTALSHAIEDGNILFAKALIENNSNPNIIYFTRTTSIDYAPIIFALYNWSTHKDIEFIKNLIDKTTRLDILERVKELSNNKNLNILLKEKINNREQIIRQNLKKV